MTSGARACPYPYVIVACRNSPDLLYKQAKVALDSLYKKIAKE